MSLKTSYEFTLPRGYVDGSGTVHRTGRMRLATARDELEPLRDPLITGPDDPRLTVLVLARVVEELGQLSMVTAHEIEGLFAADLAFLQDFYGVINFGNQDEFDALVMAQQDSNLLGTETPVARSAADSPVEDSESPSLTSAEAATGQASRPALRTAVEELPRKAQ